MLREFLLGSWAKLDLTTVVVGGFGNIATAPRNALEVLGVLFLRGLKLTIFRVSNFGIF